MARSGLCFALLCALLLAAPAGAQTPAPGPPGRVLEGWGLLKFGMSPVQARAVPGLEFGRYSRKNLLDEDRGAMGAKKPVSVQGVPYALDLYFDSFQALREIGLQSQKPMSQSACEAAFLSLLAQMEKTYGGLSPVYPQQKKNDQSVLPIAVEWKQSPGASRYQLATVFLSGETAYVWDARRNFGGRYVDAAAVWSGAQDSDQAACLTQLDFKS